MIRDEATSKRLHTDRKMMGILSLFTVLGVCLLVIIVVVSDTMSGLRAYSTLQSNWTERRKEAVFLFVEYLEKKEDIYLKQFHNSLEIVDAASNAREELFEENTDREVVREYLLMTHAVPEDIYDMIITFERFHTFPDFENAINAWIESERLVGEIQALAGRAQSMIAENPAAFARQSQQQFINRARAFDRQLTVVQYELASSLSSGSHFLARVILLISASLGIILLVIGSFLSARFSKSIRKWRRVIEISEQRYRSLFEQNPNAVFSMTNDGRIIDQNEAMKRITGYGRDELAHMKAEQLVIPEQREMAQELFNEVVQGHPQSFEIRWKRITGELLPLYLTYLPIYVDEKMVGVFGIADDITYQKHVEEQLKQQLKEKTLLLAEVHDRVKNNLALISGLLQLEGQVTDNKNTQRELESTKSRIHSMAMVHERLYHVETFSNIRMDEYVRELVKSIRKTFNPTAKDDVYKIIIEADPITLDIKRAIPCGLLLNEVIANAFKFSLKGAKHSQILIRLKMNKDNIHIQIKDNGEGFGENFNIDEQKSMGMILIRTLAKQLDGKLDIKSEEGAEVNLVFQNESRISKTA